MKRKRIIEILEEEYDRRVGWIEDGVDAGLPVDYARGVNAGLGLALYFLRGEHGEISL